MLQGHTSACRSCLNCSLLLPRRHRPAVVPSLRPPSRPARGQLQHALDALTGMVDVPREDRTSRRIDGLTSRAVPNLLPMREHTTRAEGCAISSAGLGCASAFCVGVPGLASRPLSRREGAPAHRRRREKVTRTRQGYRVRAASYERGSSAVPCLAATLGIFHTPLGGDPQRRLAPSAPEGIRTGRRLASRKRFR